MSKREFPQLNPWLLILFNILTLGIYGLVWRYRVKEFLKTKKQDIPHLRYLFYPLFLFIPSIILVLISDALTEWYEDPTGIALISLIFGVLLYIAAIFLALGVFIWWHYKFTKAIGNHIKDESRFVILFVMTIFNDYTWFIWMPLSQHWLNENEDKK